jgi:hypothetical protein
VGRETEDLKLGGMQRTAYFVYQGDKASMTEMSRLLLLLFVETEEESGPIGMNALKGALNEEV